MARLDYSNIPTKVEQLTEEQQKEYRRLVVSRPNLNEEALVFLAWMGEERYRNWLGFKTTKMPSQFIVYSLVSSFSDKFLSPTCFTRLTVEECIRDFESVAKDSEYYVVWDDFDISQNDSENKYEFHLATTYFKDSEHPKLGYWNFREWYISKNTISLFPDSTFITSKNEIVQW